MSKKPLVSINMITYNHEPYIAQAIEGVINQRTVFLFELVIGEDGSTDNTRQIVYDYQIKYPDIIKVISSDNNVGMFENFIRVEKACRGKYIAYCEGDDYWIDPYKLQKQFDFLEKHPECGLVHTDYNILYEETGFLEKNIHKELKTNLFGNCFEKYWNMVGNRLAIKTLTVFLRADYKYDCNVIIQMGIEENWKLGDFPRFALISRCSEIGYLSEATSIYRSRMTGSATSNDNYDLNKSIEFSESILSIRKFLINYLDLEFVIFKPSLVKDCRKIMVLSYRNRNIAKFMQYHAELLTLSCDSLFDKILYLTAKSNSHACHRLVSTSLTMYCFTLKLVFECLRPSLFLCKINRKVRTYFV